GTHLQARGADDAETLRAQSYLGIALVGQQKFAEAEEILRTCVAGSIERQPVLWTTFKRRSLLGTALLGQARAAKRVDPAQAESKFAAAEQELVAGYEGLQVRVGEGGWWMLEASQALVDLYTAWDKPDEVAKWQKELQANVAEKPATP